MAFGTAGLTAGLCLRKLLAHGLKPEDGDVFVSGVVSHISFGRFVEFLSRIVLIDVAISIIVLFRHNNLRRFHQHLAPPV